MKYLLVCFLYLSCNTSTDKKEKPTDFSKPKVQDHNCTNYDTLLMQQSLNFDATTLRLNESISKDFAKFLLDLDTNCLRKQTHYRDFISVIMAKLYLHHLRCCNQSYNVLDMKEGAATVVINEYQRLMGYSNMQIEMLGSGTIENYVKSDSILKHNRTIEYLLQKIETEGKRIEKGVFKSR